MRIGRSSLGQELLSGNLGQAQRPIWVSHEAVNDIVRVEEKSGHRPVRSNAVDVRTLAGARARARNVELNDGAVFIAHKAVIHICLVSIPSCDRPIRIYAKRKRTLERAGARAWSIERGKDPIH